MSKFIQILPFLAILSAKSLPFTDHNDGNEIDLGHYENHHQANHQLTDPGSNLSDKLTQISNEFNKHATNINLKIDHFIKSKKSTDYL